MFFQSAKDKEYVKQWKENHTLMTVTFWWYSKGSEQECRLKNRTFNQALMVAKSFGYKEPTWYNPWTWFNGVVTVG